MRKLLVILMISSSAELVAQQTTQVLLHLQSADTLVLRSIVSQISNIKKAFPDAEVELVCHGPGLDFLLKEKSVYVNKLQRMNLKNVSFAGCEFTMAQRNVKREDLVDFTKTVPFGIAEIIKKQQANWLYVKLGF